MVSDLEQLRCCSLAFDLGTARTRIHLQGSGLIVDEPSVVALCTRTGRLIAAGSAAQALEGRADGRIEILRPICAGTVTDITIAQRMLRMFLHSQMGGWRSRLLMRRVAVGVPHGSGQVALDAVAQVLRGLGARRVVLVDRVFAVAVGCGLDTGRAEGTMVVHCGTLSTQIAVLALGSVVTAQSVPVGEQSFLTALEQHIRSTHQLALPLRGLEDVCRLLAAQPPPAAVELCGREPVTGAWRTVQAATADLQRTVQIPMGVIVHAVGQVLRATPADLVADLAVTGLTVTGSSTTRLGLDQMLHNATGITTRTPARPELSVIRGLGDLLDGAPRPGHTATGTGSDPHAHEHAPEHPARQCPAVCPALPDRSNAQTQSAPVAVQEESAAGADGRLRSGRRARVTDPVVGKVRRPCRRTRLKYPSAWDPRSGRREMRGKNGTGTTDAFRRPARYPK